MFSCVLGVGARSAIALTWGTRKVHLAARFSGAVFLGVAFLAVLSIIALDGRHWLGH